MDLPRSTQLSRQTAARSGEIGVALSVREALDVLAWAQSYSANARIVTASANAILAEEARPAKLLHETGGTIMALALVEDAEGSWSRRPSARFKPDQPADQELTRAERHAAGKALRKACPRESHATWKPPRDRRDAVELVLAAEKGRLPELLPLRHGRMARSAFTFYRGSALTMAADLASTPVSGIRVQCCGDAHLCNFGGFATPERRIISPWGPRSYRGWTTTLAGAARPSRWRMPAQDRPPC